jgi:hypothetical protein
VNTSRQRIDRASKEVIKRLCGHVRDEGKLCVIKAPPGSGKTFTLLRAIREAADAESRVAVAGQTNSQCDDICRRFVQDNPESTIWRFLAASGTGLEDTPSGVRYIQETGDLPDGPAIVVATTAKWSTVGDFDPYDFLFIDEAWQLAWADFMILGRVASRFVLIGDPGQIAPVISIPVKRWETAPRPPHRPAPDVILADPSIDCLRLDLVASRRLPAEGVDLVRPFYDFDFDAWAAPGERFVRCVPASRSRNLADRGLDLLNETNHAILTLATPPQGPPLEADREIAALAAEVANRALKRGAVAAYDDSGNAVPLTPGDIGITATHRVMNTAIKSALPQRLRQGTDSVRVDTPERWQGLERKFMIVVHPLSGVVHPSTFDLETGRLCVTASRHQSAMLIVSRDHVPETLDTHVPVAEQAVGQPDVAGRGHAQNTNFWRTLAEQGHVLSAS